MMNSAHTLSLQEIVFGRGANNLVSQFSLTVEPGSVLGILGPNGVGKSSLISACTGELALRSGVIRYGDLVLNPKEAWTFSRIRAVLPQHSQLTFNIPVRQLITMGAYPFPEIATAQVKAWTDEAIDIADLECNLDRPYGALSGGEQQRVHFARVLVQTLAIRYVRGHAYLLLDEPTSSLDLKHQAALMRAVNVLACDGTTTVVVVLHDLNMAAQWCDTILLLSRLHAPMHGKTNEMLVKEKLEDVYGIQMHVQSHPLRPGEVMILT
jgi:iron complex transport system ATP-binding protein